VTDVPLSGARYGEATAMAYLASGELALADRDGHLYTITQSGEVTFAADLDAGVSGLVLLRKGVGENVCIATPSSTGAPASMSAFGSDRARPGDALTLTAEPVPDQVGIFFFGSSAREVPFGHGYLCVGGGVTRMLPRPRRAATPRRGSCTRARSRRARPPTSSTGSATPPRAAPRSTRPTRCG